MKNERCDKRGYARHGMTFLSLILFIFILITSFSCAEKHNEENKNATGIEKTKGSILEVLEVQILEDDGNGGELLIKKKGIEKKDHLAIFISASVFQNFENSIMEFLETYGRQVRDVTFKGDIEKKDLLRFLSLLENVKNVKILSNAEIADLKCIEPLRGLDALLIFSCSRIENLNGLSGHDLRKLEIHDCPKLSGIQTVSQNVNLDRLVIVNSLGLKDLDCLKTLKNLDSLYLRFLGIRKLDFLNNAQRLEALFVFDCPWLTDISAISHLENLVFLKMHNLPNIKKLPSFFDNKKLLAVELKLALDIMPEFNHMNSQLKSFAFINNRAQRMVCEIGFNDAGEFFETADTEDVPMQTMTLKGIEKLTNLKMLFLSGVEIEDLAPISDLPKIFLLGIQKNIKLISLTPISQLQKLEYLYLAESKIKDITPLYGLKKLKVLDISNTEVPIEQKIEFERKNPQCKVVDKEK